MLNLRARDPVIVADHKKNLLETKDVINAAELCTLKRYFFFIVYILSPFKKKLRDCPGGPGVKTLVLPLQGVQV